MAANPTNPADPTMPIDPARLDALAHHDTPTIANAIQGLGIRPATEGFTRPPVRALFPHLGPAVGRAVTITITSSEPFEDPAAEREAMLPLYDAVAALDGPTLVVVADLDQGPGCLWGEVNATICRTLDARGVVTDGLVRDVGDVEPLGFHYLARGVGVARAYTRIRSVGTPVEVGGARFEPGDLVHADRHGAIVVPVDRIDDVVDAAERVTAREQQLLDWVRSPDFDPAELAARRARH
ncbi:MAG: RraA family protein [Actinomycetota bacterium]|nr:RraA family protein [Actinomycetota bacterium]